MFDSIKASISHKPKLYGNFNTRNSFISNYRAQVQGVSAGVTFNKQFTVALGYNWLASDFKKTISPIEKGSLKIRYFSPFIEYSFLEKNNIEVTIPIYLGFGNAFYETEDKKQLRKRFILLYEPSMKVTYRLLKYFAVSAGIGFRVLLAGNSLFEERFNSPTYTLGAGIFFADLFRDLKKALK